MNEIAALTPTSMQQKLNQWVEHYRQYTNEGACASYIPALKKADLNSLGIYMLSDDGIQLKSGDTEQSFTLQSISKVLSFIHACSSHGISHVLEYVDVEPTGDAFNSIFRLELSHPGRPFNPMINAGAITVASMLPGQSPDEKVDGLLCLIEKMVGRKPRINEEVFLSEWGTANRNRSLAYWLKETGFLLCPVEDAIEVYLRLCSIELCIADMAKIGLLLARDGIQPGTYRHVFSKEIASLTKTLMFTCGMYDYSGRFAAFVGIPAKSGVSGGIMAAIPSGAAMPSNNRPDSGPWGIGVYGPSIDKFGNSIAGVKLLKRLAKEWDFRLL
ncbi:MAG: glutaminase [Bacillota bacterium]|nr:glutaminase [Bacillota bacterium]MDP4171466.1 glutaminase [Bacillota bacterium]